MSTKPRKRRTVRTVNETALERRVRALKEFASSPFFVEVMLTLKENAFWGQRPFDASGFDPYKAATVEGRQTLVDLLEIEINKALRWTPPTQP